MKVIIEAQGACVVNPRGIHVYAIELIRGLLKRESHKYGLAFFDYLGERGSRKLIKKRFSGLKTEVFECNDINYAYLNYDLAYLKKSYNDYIGTDADVFHITAPYTVPAKIRGQMIVTIHDMIPVLPFYGVLPYYNPYPEVAHNLQRICNNDATVIAVSHATKTDIVNYTDIPEERVHVVYSGIDHDTHFPQKNAEALKRLGVGARFFLCIGMAHEYRKNFERILQAFEIVAEKNDDVQLVSIGVHIPDNIKKLVANSEYKERIVLLQYVSDDEKRWLLSDTEALLYPSIYEGFGLPIVEAMACGAPVIASDTSSMPEAAGDCAILVDPYSVENMAHEMERVLNNQSLKTEVMPKGIAHSKKFTWEKTAEETEKVYSSRS
ncbi:MAG: glycosyltransferase family 4 protein [Defluviitaleaceae bacterium]|nr:glycosyltransferase family 4 protein [Defluviitaleaceae bacterium]